MLLIKPYHTESKFILRITILVTHAPFLPLSLGFLSGEVLWTVPITLNYHNIPKTGLSQSMLSIWASAYMKLFTYDQAFAYVIFWSFNSNLTLYFLFITTPNCVVLCSNQNQPTILPVLTQLSSDTP